MNTLSNFMVIILDSQLDRDKYKNRDHKIDGIQWMIRNPTETILIIDTMRQSIAEEIRPAISS